MVNYRPPLVGVIGKTNVGKSTLFSAMTMAPVEISNRPFTTIEPNRGVGYVRIKCPHVDFGLPQCNPRSGFCLKGNRFVPLELMDVAGLIPGAHEGRGLGNKFMDDLRRADAFILVVDASGSTDEEGNPVEPGTRDPVREVKEILREVDLWIRRVIKDDWERFARNVETRRLDLSEALYEKLSGLSIRRSGLIEALRETGLESKPPSSWKEEDFTHFSTTLRRVTKPLVIAANKVDLKKGLEGYERLRSEIKEYPVVPVSALSELALMRANKNGLIEYLPGDNDFTVKEDKNLTDKQAKGLEYIREKVLKPIGGTGVQQLLRTTVYDAMGKVIVFPVDDASRLTDKKGNILPDALIVDSSATVGEVAGLIHTDLKKGFLYAIDAWKKNRMGEDHKVYDRLVFKIVSSMRG